MKPCNLISVYQGASALEESGLVIEKKYKVLKSHEIRNLHSFCDEMSVQGCTISDFDGFCVGYAIGQIGKEFDLLRFGDDILINIEIKSELKVANKQQKILRQMQINFYYLKFLGRPIKIFTYVENDGFYEYISESDSLSRVEPSIVAQCLKNHVVNYLIDPDKEFVPSNYLISPFNSTEKFLNEEYFLTTAQQKIKDEIQSELADTPFMYFTISANAGTGKTLLLYDIAKELMKRGKTISLIHCGKLNGGHEILRVCHGWSIYPIRDIKDQTIDRYLEKCSLLFVDEAQRIRHQQLVAIINCSIKMQVPIIFSYDIKQYLRSNENRDISEYLRSNYPEIPLSGKKLTAKIRTNKRMASFVTNLFDIGCSRDHLNYDCVTIEYLDNMDDLTSYLEFLKKSGWMPLTFTTSQYDNDPYDQLSEICEKKAHDVIGQEFSKVVLVLDTNFKYNEKGRLTARNSYYSAKGMLYQIVTRVIDELKIIVLQNTPLYLKLLEIKSMGAED